MRTGTEYFERLLAGIVAFLIIVWSLVLIAHADPNSTEPKADEKKPKVESICPITKISDNARCMDCHVVAVRDGKPKWTLKEIDPHKEFNYPCRSFRFSLENGQKVAKLLLSSIDSELIEQTFVYLNQHSEIKKLILELHNPGGSMMGMWRIVGLMDSWKSKGNIIETQCQGFSASASFVVFVNGSKGHRKAAPESLHMWHEAMSFSMFNITTASSSEEEAKTMRKFQDTAHNWLAARSKISKDEIDRNVNKREWWLTGSEMVKAGFADGYIGE